MKTPTGIEYNGLRIQRRAYRKAGEREKALLSYDQSLEQLRNKGYERHLRPAEAFTLLAEGLEGRLTPDLKKVYDNMLTSYGEWVSMAMERKGDTLITYLDPKGLKWDGQKYVKTPEFNFQETKVFGIKGMKSQEYIDLNQWNPELVQYVYGRAFANFPSEMKERSYSAQLYLPAEGMVQPVGRGNFRDRFYAGSGFRWAVRGVANVGGARRKHSAEKHTQPKVSRTARAPTRKEMETHTLPFLPERLQEEYREGLKKLY